MKFTGQIRVPEIDHPGVPATFVIEGSQAEVILEGDESLGRWSLYDVHARRLVASAFQVDLDGEEITFVADEPIDFAYRGVEHMAEVWAKFRSMNVVRRTIAVSRSRTGTEPSRVEAFRSAIEENLEAQSERGRLAGSVTSHAPATGFTPESVAREVESLQPSVETPIEEEERAPGIPLAGEPSMKPGSVPEAESQIPKVGEPNKEEEPKEVASPSELERLAEERRAIEEERARLEEQRKQLEALQDEAEQREADRVEAFRLEMKRLEEERVEYERLEAERQATLREAMERLEAERGEVERKSAEQRQREQEDAKRAEALQVKLNALEEERLRREREESERVAAARAKMEQLEQQRKKIESMERVQEAEAAERVAEEAASREDAPAATAPEETPAEKVESAANVVDLDELEEQAEAREAEQETDHEPPEEPEPETPEEPEREERRPPAQRPPKVPDRRAGREPERQPERQPSAAEERTPEPVLAMASDEKQGGIMGAVRAAFGRGGNGHTHEFVEAPGGLGITRSICRECGHVSISTGD